MFVANVIETVEFQHCCQVILLYYPDSIRSQNLSHVLRESVRILKIVKHCNAGYYLGLSLAKFLFECLCAKEIVEDPVGSFASLLNEILGRFESHEKQSFSRV